MSKKFRPPSSKLDQDRILKKIYDDINQIARPTQTDRKTPRRDQSSDFKFVHDKGKGQYAMDVRFPDGWKRFVAEDSRTKVSPQIVTSSEESIDEESSGTVSWADIEGIPDTFTPSAHNHSAADINAGVLAVDYGGTGLNATTEGFVVIGGPNNTYAFLTREGIDTRDFFPPEDHNHNASEITLGVLHPARGGTGVGVISNNTALVGNSTNGYDLLGSADFRSRMNIEAAFSKGNILAGQNMNITGTLTSRLVGSGDIGINVDLSSVTYTVGAGLQMDLDNKISVTAELAWRTSANTFSASNDFTGGLSIGGTDIYSIFSQPGHTHSAGDITQGSLAVARGGTEIGIVSNNTVLIGNSLGRYDLIGSADLRSRMNLEASFSKGNLIAGQNVNLTGTLTSRLVGSGDIGVNIDLSSVTYTVGSGLQMDLNNEISVTAELAWRSAANTFTASNDFTGGLSIGGTDIYSIFSEPGHTHSASDITIGALHPARGGTGIGVISNNTVLIGNASNGYDLVGSADLRSRMNLEAAFSKGDLIAGTNVNLTGTLTNRLVGSGDIGVNIDLDSVTYTVGSGLQMDLNNKISVVAGIAWRTSANTFSATNNFTGPLQIDGTAIENVFVPASGGTFNGDVSFNNSLVSGVRYLEFYNASNVSYKWDIEQHGGNGRFAIRKIENGSNTHLFALMGNGDVRAEGDFYAQDVEGNTNRVWHEGNDGAGSNLDADKLDGQHGSYYTNASNIGTGQLATARGGTGHSVISNNTVLLGNTANGYDLVGSADLRSRMNLEPSFSKGSLLAGTNVNLTGTLTNRLVGSGDIGINIELDSVTYTVGSGLQMDTNNKISVTAEIAWRTSANTFTSTNTFNSNVNIATTKELNFGLTYSRIYETSGDTLIVSGHNGIHFQSYEGGTSTLRTPMEIGYTSVSVSGSLSATTGMSVSGNTVWHAGNDGANSGLDADYLDGNHASAFSLTTHSHPYQKHILTNDTGLNQSASTDWDNYDVGGFYMGSSLANQPTSGAMHSWKYIAVQQHNNIWSVQQSIDFSGHEFHFRVKENGTWRPWNRIWHSDNLSSLKASAGYYTANDNVVFGSISGTTGDFRNDTNNSSTSVLNSNQGIRIRNYDTTDGTYSLLKLETRPDGDGAFIRGINKGNNNVHFSLGRYASGGSVSEDWLYIDNGGNVGIGDPTPSYKLDVSGTGRFTNTLTVNSLVSNGAISGTTASFLATGAIIASFESSLSGVSGIKTERTNGDWAKLVANYSGYGAGIEVASKFRLSVNGNPIGSPALLIDTNGDVGIGTTSPAYKLDVDGTGRFTNALRATDFIFV